MNEKTYKEIERNAFRFMLYSIIHYANEIENLSEEEADKLINMLFNVMTNSLKPESAILFNDTIFEHIENIKTKNEIELQNIFQDIGWKNDN